MERINPTNDLAFKKVFASEEHKDVLGGLIDDFFNVKAEDIVIANPYSIDIIKNSKDINRLSQTLRDVSATFKTADFISELQIAKTRYFDERSLYYACKRFCDNYNVSGRIQINPDGTPNRYSSLKPVYALNILGYSHFKDEDALRIFELHDPKRNKYFDKQLLKIAYFEYLKANIETENQRHWRDYFTTGDVKFDAPNYIKKANQIIDKVNLSEEEWVMSENLEKALATMEAQLDYKYHEGAESRSFEIAKSMLQYGDAPEKVSTITGLSLSQIQQL